VELASFSGVELGAALPDVPPEGAPDPPAEEPIVRDVVAVDDEEPPKSVTLGVFFPDGACRAGSPLYVVSSDGARRAIHLRPLTSRVEVRLLPTAEEEAAQAASADETSELVPVARREDDR
jgi:hypothetical protein